MNRRAWRVTLHRVTKSQTRLKQLNMHTLKSYCSVANKQLSKKKWDHSVPLRHIHRSFLKMIVSFLITKYMFVAESVGMHKRRKELTLETYYLEKYHYLFYFYPLPPHPRFARYLQSCFSKVTVHFTVLLAFHKLVQLISQKKKKPIRDQ